MADGAITQRQMPGAPLTSGPGPAVSRPPVAPQRPGATPAQPADHRDDTVHPIAPGVETTPADRARNALPPADTKRRPAPANDNPPLRIVPLGEAVPEPVGTITDGTARVTPEVAGNIITNIAAGQPGFRPELGLGGASWFLTEGSPHAGLDASKNVNIPADVHMPANRLVFREAELTTIFNRIRDGIDMGQAEAEFRQLRASEGRPLPDGPLSGNARRTLERFLSQRTEQQMWNEIARQVCDSPSRAGEVILENSRFSKKGNGRFFLTSDAAHVRVRGGVPAVMNALDRAGHSAEPGVLEAASRLASEQRWAGAVRGAFRIGGRVLLVVGVAADTYRIITATDKARTITEVAGGWTGALGASAAFAAWYTPADVAGPWAWLGHGVGTLAAGAVGYWAGSTITRTIYDIYDVYDITVDPHQ